MKEELITFDTAKLAKEKGFDVAVPRYYTEKGNLVVHHQESFGESDFYFDCEDFDSNWNNKNSTFYLENNKVITCSAPTQSLLQRWLRENMNINVLVVNYYDKFSCVMKTTNDHHRDGYSIKSILTDTYEKALEAGLLKALKLIKL